MEKEDYNCPICEDKGYILKTEWTTDEDDRDVDYERMVKCECREE